MGVNITHVWIYSGKDQLEYAVVLISLTAMLLYLRARICIAGESFISLRYFSSDIYRRGLACQNVYNMYNKLTSIETIQGNITGLINLYSTAKGSYKSIAT